MQHKKTKSLPIILIDDDRATLETAAALLGSNGHEELLLLDRGTPLLEAIKGGASLILLDLSLPDIAGVDLIPLLRTSNPEVPVIVVSGSGDIETAVRCMHEGAYDYLVKPVEPSRYLSAVARALESSKADGSRRSVREHFLSGKLTDPLPFAPILSRSPAMFALFLYLESVAPSGEPLLIQGETGTGKELFATAAHHASGRAGELVSVNVAGLDDAMVADSLFGHRKGAFTGADEAREGLVHRASKGTLFLDEIGDLSEQSQVKLLRLIENGEYYPVGSDSPRRASVRFVLSTNRDLRLAAEEGRFRRDLYYRIGIHELRVPPLRERRADIGLLAATFEAEAAIRFGRPEQGFAPEIASRLADYDFPGNVRELRAIVFDAVGRSSLDGLPPAKAGAGARAGAGAVAAGAEGALSFGPVLPSLREAEEALVDEALRRSGGNQSAAARLLGISHQALNKRLSQSG